MLPFTPHHSPEWLSGDVTYSSHFPNLEACNSWFNFRLRDSFCSHQKFSSLLQDRWVVWQRTIEYFLKVLLPACKLFVIFGKNVPGSAYCGSVLAHREFLSGRAVWDPLSNSSAAVANWMPFSLLSFFQAAFTCLHLIIRFSSRVTALSTTASSSLLSSMFCQVSSVSHFFVLLHVS